MKKALTIFILFISVLTLTPQQVHAECGSTVVGANGNLCYNSDDELLTSFTRCQEDNSICCSTVDDCENFLDVLEGPNSQYFDSINPLVTEGNPEISSTLTTPGGIVSRVLLFLFPIAGLILFVMIVWGGFEILSKSTSGTKGMEAGKNRITAAIVGFMLLFATYWMAQIIEVIFGIVIV